MEKLFLHNFRSHRANIAIGSARGLSYLHSQTPSIIHGDIKSSNILLDEHFEPKIGDFGLARGGSDNPCDTHITVRKVYLTQGYVPDDYLRNGHLCVQVDTYSYGILLFELITGNFIE